MSPGLVRDWKGMGVPFSRPDTFYTSAAPLLGGSASRVARAVLVPMGHIYATEDFGYLKLDLAAEEARVRAENDHVAAEAARFGARATALCSAPVLRPYAMRELARCAQHPAVGGIKVHIASSGVDLRDASHREAMRRVTAWAAAQKLPLLLHLDPQRRGHDSSHVERFLDEVIAPFPSLTVIIAHLGGSGGYGRWTQQVFAAAQRSVQKMNRGPNDAGVFFDVSAVLLERSSEGVPATTPADATRLAEDLRRAGLDRVVFGSDWPVFEPELTLSALNRLLNLSTAERARLASKAVEPFFARRRN